MSIIVQKFGGSSVADVASLQRVAEKIVATREAGHDVVVAVSAMGNTTDDLLRRATALTRTPDRRELDMLLSVGERISMTLLSMAIHALGHEAISFTGSQCGIITNDSHSNARIIEVRPFRVQDELARGRIVIVAGYQGTSYKREVTTLGRGGTDLTAIALAGALGAEKCEIYSDVDGVFSSDPRVVLTADRLDEISADEMLTLARHGAQVLHDQAIAYARKHKIALHARSTNAPVSKGTVVRPDGWPHEALRRAAVTPRGVASLDPVVLVHTDRASMAPLCEQLSTQHTLALVSAQANAQGATLVLDPTNAPDLDEALRTVQTLGAHAHADYCSVSLVGDDIGRELGWTHRGLDGLQTAGIKTHGLFVEQHVIMVLVDRSARKDAMLALHELVTH